MSRIQPISTTRVTESLTRDRLTAQIQRDQLDLFRLQDQLSTGFRLFLPSDDAAAAQRAMSLQRTLERKEQSQTNLEGARASLTVTEAALAGVSDSLNSLKSSALGAVDSIASDSQRQAVIDEIDGLLFELTRVGNATFATNFLLGGAERSSEAYRQFETYVEYLGDESSPQTFIDIGQLFDQGVSGDEVLGGLSEAVRGSADLNAQLTPATRLDALNGGVGANPEGSIEISFQPTIPTDPSSVATIDLSAARTVDDIARIIESNAPAGSDLVVSVENNALRVDSPSGALTITDVGSGTVAAELGIVSTSPGVSTITGADLDPVIDVTTRLGDLLGSKTRARIVSPGDNNDLVLTADQNGDLNDLEVYYQSGGAVSAAYSAGPPNTITVTVVDGETTAAEVADAINSSGATPFTAEVDYRDQTNEASRGNGAVSAAPTTDLASGVGGGVAGDLDLAAGLLVTNGVETYTIDTSAAETVEDLLGLLNDPQYGLAATVNAAGDGIDVRTRRSGAAFSIAENGGTLAAQLGLRTYSDESRLADFNFGEGVFIEGQTPEDTAAQNEFTIQVIEDGVITDYAIDATGLQTVGDLRARIAADTGGAIDATLATTGNGLVLTATDPDSPAAAASGSFSLGADTLTIAATSTGPAGNRPFTVEVVDSGGPGALTTTVVGDVITVELNGAAHNTDTIAASIEAQLTGFTVTSAGPIDSIAAPVAVTPAATTGGAEPSANAEAATGSFTLNGDAINFVADATGFEGNAGFTINLVDDGTDGLATTVDPTDPTVVTVNLGGADSDTAAIAASLSAALDGYTVTADPAIPATPAAVLQTDAGTLAAPVPFVASVTGGHSVDSITVSGGYAERLGFFGSDVDSITVEDGPVTSADNNTLQVDSVFTTLIRMREALEAGDEIALGREINRLDEDIDRVTFGRAEVGVRLRNLDLVADRLSEEEVTLREALSNEIDADLVEVISDYTLKQASLQASLQTSASLLSLSILDFI